MVQQAAGGVGREDRGEAVVTKDDTRLKNSHGIQTTTADVNIVISLPLRA